MMRIKRRQGKVDLVDITKQAVEAVKYVDSWNKDKKDEYAPVSGFSWSTKDTDKPDRFRFERPDNGHADGIKRKAYQRIFTHTQKRLNKSDKRNEGDKNKLSLSSIHAYSGKIRKAIQEKSGALSLTLEQDIKNLVKKYPTYEQQLTKISRADAVMIGAIKKAVENKIHDDDTALSAKLYNDLQIISFDNEVVRKLGLDASDSKTRKDSIRKNRSLRKTNAITLSLSSIVRIMNKCLASEKFNELVLGIALATGRRAIEIIHVGRFSKTRGNKNIKFLGQAKASKLQKETPNIIPMLVDANIVLDAVDRLGEIKKTMSTFTLISDIAESEQNIIINRRMAHGLNKTIRCWFDNEQMVFHTSRVIAVKTALAVIYPKSKDRSLDDGEFMARYTGHTLNGTSSYADNASYEHVHIEVNGADNITPYKEAGGDDTKRDVEVMRKLLNALEDDTLSTSKPFIKWYGKVIEEISKYPFKLTQSSVSKGYKHNGEVFRIGGGRIAVRRYFKHPVIEAHINQYNEGA